MEILEIDEQLRRDIDSLSMHLVKFYGHNQEALEAYSIRTLEAVESLLEYLKELRQTL